MKLKFERSRPQERDIVLMEPDGTVFTFFAKTGYLSAATRTRFASGHAAATGAFSISSGQSAEGTATNHATANHGLVFISEVYGEEKIALIERFATEDDARNALSLVQGAVRRHIVGRRRQHVWRLLLRHVGAPLLMLIVAMAGVRFLDSHNGSLEALNALVRAAQANPGSQAALLPGVPPAGPRVPPPEPSGHANPSSLQTQPAPGAAPSDVSASRPLAAPHSPALASAMTSIHFGLENQPPKKTLYVYSDPNCPACKRFESHIDELAKDFSIYVFPVAYQDGSAKVAAQILCAADRKQKWVDTMARTKPGDPMTGSDCAQAYAGIKANMEAFDALGFNSTPRVVGGNGLAFGEGATANAIRIQSAAQ